MNTHKLIDDQFIPNQRRRYAVDLMNQEGLTDVVRIKIDNDFGSKWYSARLNQMTWLEYTFEERARFEALIQEIIFTMEKEGTKITLDNFIIAIGKKKMYDVSKHLNGYNLSILITKGCVYTHYIEYDDNKIVIKSTVGNYENNRIDIKLDIKIDSFGKAFLVRDTGETSQMYCPAYLQIQIP